MPRINIKEGCKQKFFKRRYTNSQKAYEKMFNIIHHKGNENQNHDEVSLHTDQDGFNKEEQKITRVGGRKQRNWSPIHCWQGCKNAQMLWKSCSFSKVGIDNDEDYVTL